MSWGRGIGVQKRANTACSGPRNPPRGTGVRSDKNRSPHAVRGAGALATCASTGRRDTRKNWVQAGSRLRTLRVCFATARKSGALCQKWCDNRGESPTRPCPLPPAPCGDLRREPSAGTQRPPSPFSSKMERESPPMLLRFAQDRRSPIHPSPFGYFAGTSRGASPSPLRAPMGYCGVQAGTMSRSQTVGPRLARRMPICNKSRFSRIQLS